MMNLGDRVRVTADREAFGFQLKGREEYIVDAQNGQFQLLIQVQPCDVLMVWFADDELALVVEPKAGDRVRVVKDLLGDSGCLGCTGTVLRIETPNPVSALRGEKYVAVVLLDGPQLGGEDVPFAFEEIEVIDDE